ncbi:MAG: tyrosine-type recombinase/integrase [Vicinamibacterales bacterium]
MVTVRPYRRGGWEVDIRVTLPDDSEHRQRRRAPVTSKSAAQRWGEERERHWYYELTHPPAAGPAKEVPTLKDFVNRFLDGHARANRQKPSGIAQKEIALRVHVVPRLGEKRLDAISSEDIQRLKHDMRQKAVKTVNNVLTVLNTLLKKAVEWDVIPRLPCTLKLLKVAEGSVHFWDFDEYQRLVEAGASVDPRAHLVVLLGGDAGLRAGEMRALEWSDVDLVKRQLRVERSEWRGEITSTKGGRVRYVPMTQRLAAALKRSRQLRGPRVLCEADGKPLTANALTYLLERASRKAGLATGRKPRHAGPHVLRHTFCSHLAMRGAPVRAIQELAGHRDLATTQRYMHLSPVAIENAIRLLEHGGATPHFGDIVETGLRENATACV